jgi:hypothetical protein
MRRIVRALRWDGIPWSEVAASPSEAPSGQKDGRCSVAAGMEKLKETFEQ